MKRTFFKVYSLFIIFLVSTPTSSFSACTAPDGAQNYVIGDNKYKYCDGSSWEEVITSGTLGGCTGAGKLEYDSGQGAYKYCDGTNWQNTKGTANGSCAGTPAATKEKIAGGFHICDGTTWYKQESITGPITHVLTSGTSWSIPADWNSANNSIECIGGGGGGDSGSGGTAGNYGGAGGGRGVDSGTAGSGAQGVCVITYTP